MRKIQNENILYLDYEKTILDYVCDLFDYVTFFHHLHFYIVFIIYMNCCSQ